MKKIGIVMLVLLFLTACGNRDEDVIEPMESESELDQQATSVQFRNVDVNIESEQFHIIGEVNSSGGLFYYKVELNGEIIQEEAYEQVENSTNEWSEFEIVETLPREVLEGNDPPVVVLYGKNQSGEPINENYVPIDTQN
ncbi:MULTISPECIES: hypothetical protein [Oceanobacillus]|uniref:Uncharacterized protein n=1 Tax=Oceanobacillus kimchii TaxID=746691 RepID=A0ABQ5TFI1_9BACI|nr:MULTISPECIES: hypothetical protein [Oceanobacillus]MBT2599054.1 hypothetical protein [Oceanobacillus sp. ISL-74]MBT2651972.1 hypothetical protein [Oceanobacillus sp. ISL-73]MCT1578691.1 hypothetical protein [Oceanobacillus kimchii]MCT2136260.1 hypothetical protein [Oceanobacillus kimchii]OEH54328.1 hypothetical protein AQ616_11240 [Oceanobacillus sp. E9]